jgi:hypothetical protein
MILIPIYTTGDINEPSIIIPTKYNSDSDFDYVFVSTYTGKILPEHPTVKTKIDVPRRKNSTFHGGILINKNTVMCHGVTYNN